MINAFTPQWYNAIGVFHYILTRHRIIDTIGELNPTFSTLSAVGIHCFKALKEWNSGIGTQIIDTFAVFNEYADDYLFYTIIIQPITCRCNIFTYDSRYCVYCLMSACYEVCVAMCKIFRGQSGDCIFTKKPIKSTKMHFFYNF